jgi:TPP-dependent pyruvate/acetoin dehydrogenase alpha subunit
MPDDQTLYRALYRIRRFEETVLREFSSGVFYGTTHTYIGQEADAVGVLSGIQADDIVFSNHRCHGHFIAYGGDLRALFAELMGKATGVSGGRGGSQHIHWRNFYSNGVLGSTVPVGTGTALAEKYMQNKSVTVIFIGDGALGEGVLYESLNIASLWGVPALYVVENNHIAQTTPIELSLAGNIPDRFKAFGIPAIELNTSDVAEILPIASELLDDTRTYQKPHALILHTHRFGPHSKGDDTRPVEEIEKLRATRDPLAIHAARLPKKTKAAIEKDVDAEVALAFDIAQADPFPRIAIPNS